MASMLLFPKNMCASPLAEGNLAVAVSQEMPDLKENWIFVSGLTTTYNKLTEQIERVGYFLSFPFRSPGGTYQVIGLIAVSRAIRLLRHVIRSWDHRLLVTYCALQRQCRLSLTRIKQLGEYPWLFFLKERGSININSIKITEKLNLEIFATFWSVVVWPLRMCSDKS